jgi:hypothetical protein
MIILLIANGMRLYGHNPLSCIENVNKQHVAEKSKRKTSLEGPRRRSGNVIRDNILLSFYYIFEYLMRHVPHRASNSNSSCIVACVFVSTRMCLQTRPSNGRHFWLHYLGFQALEGIYRHTNTQRTRWSHTPFFPNKESRLKLNFEKLCGTLLSFSLIQNRIFVKSAIFVQMISHLSNFNRIFCSGVNVVTTFKREMLVLNTSDIFLICIWFYTTLHGVIKRHKVVWAVLWQGDKLQRRVARVRRSGPRHINLHGSSFRLLLPQEKIYIFQIALKCGGRHNLHLNIIYRLDVCIFCVWNQQTGFFMANRLTTLSEQKQCISQREIGMGHCYTK